MTLEKNLIISGHGVELTPALKEIIEKKAHRLWDHEERIITLRFILEGGHLGSAHKEFSVRGEVSVPGPKLFALDKEDDLYKAIDGCIDKLDRKLRRRSSLIRVKRHHPHPAVL